MKIRKINFVWIVLGVVVVVGLAFGFLVNGNGPTNPENVLKLKQPSFVRSAMASEGSFLDKEAGISAYTQNLSPIDISDVRGVFRTIERETDQYIIGSVDIPDYSEDHSPHVYVHSDGWVLAYYLKTEPVSHIMDLRHYESSGIGSTKLEDVITEVNNTIGVATQDVEFYDFRYPNATNIMFVVEAAYGWDNETFEIHLPSDFPYFERSWAHTHEFYGNRSELYLDDNQVSNLYSVDWEHAYGYFTASELEPGVSHTLKINNYNNGSAFCGLALVYTEVP